jgi:hypothetical protein
VAVTPGGDTQEPLQTSRPLDLTILVLDSQEEKLVAQSKRQMLEERGIQVRPKPSIQPAPSGTLDVPPRRVPALSKLGGHLGHRYIVHRQTSHQQAVRTFVILAKMLPELLSLRYGDGMPPKIFERVALLK